jgi:hypothetical protein
MAALLREQSLEGERVLFLGPGVLIASKSEPGAWHSVEDGRCDCDSFTYRHTCRHLAVAQLAAELDRCQSVAVEAVAPATCPKCDRALKPGRSGVCATCLLTLPECPPR